MPLALNSPRLRWGIYAGLLLACVLIVMCVAGHPQAGQAPAVPSNSQSNPPEKQADPNYVGSDVCAGCHQDPASRFQHTVMGRAFAHPRNGNQKWGCESCHGPGKAHVDSSGSTPIPVRFSENSPNTVHEKNAACLSCHSRGNRMFWRGSPHESRGMTCVHCHQGHAATAPRLASDELRYNAPLTENQGVKKPQPEMCLECHQMRRAQLQRSSHMPYREGKVTCTSCHNPHGTPNPTQLIQSTINENCLTCHAERRGPFLWEHPPVMENCANCHEAHGTNNPQLLKVRMPRVCDSCHVATRHPTSPTLLNSVRDFNRACTNCHSRIHGSNHPSGDFFLR